MKEALKKDGWRGNLYKNNFECTWNNKQVRINKEALKKKTSKKVFFAIMDIKYTVTIWKCDPGSRIYKQSNEMQCKAHKQIRVHIKIQCMMP